jgi:hypothetical protein
MFPRGNEGDFHCFWRLFWNCQKPFFMWIFCPISHRISEPTKSN